MNKNDVSDTLSLALAIGVILGAVFLMGYLFNTSHILLGMLVFMASPFIATWLITRGDDK